MFRGEQSLLNNNLKMISWLILLSTSSSLILGAYLPGPCPKTEPTEGGFSFHAIEMRILIAVPFTVPSTEQTYFFEGFEEESDKPCLNVSIADHNRISLSQIYPILRNPQDLRQTIEGVLKWERSFERGQFLILESSLSGFDVESEGQYCIPYPKVIEEVQIWNDGNVTILRSCRDLEGGLNHDEAIVIFVPYVFVLLIDIIDRIEMAKLTSEKYLEKSFHEMIQWSPNRLCNYYPLNRFPCRKVSGTYFVLIIIGFILLGGLVRTFYLIIRQKLLNKTMGVHPMQ